MNFVKLICNANWILLGLYGIWLIYGLLTLNSSGIDAAGKGISAAYSTIGIIIVVVLALLNLIDLTWLRAIILCLLMWPIFSGIKGYISHSIHRSTVRAGTFNMDMFEDSNLKEMTVAINTMDLEKFNELIKKDDTKINTIGNNGRTLLNLAAGAAVSFPLDKASPMVYSLLEHGADPNIGEVSPLASIADAGSIELFTALLEAGADPNGKASDGLATIYKILRKAGGRDSTKFNLLVKKYKADPNVPFGLEGWTLNYSPLIMSASTRKWEDCITLLDHGADINFKAPSGLNFWEYLNSARQNYRNKGEAPEDFTALLLHPEVVKLLDSYQAK